MNLEQLFKTKGSAFAGVIQPSNLTTNHIPINFKNSVLDLNGISLRKPPTTTKQTTVGLAKSLLDLGGKIPSYAYLDNLPEREIYLRAVDLVK